MLGVGSYWNALKSPTDSSPRAQARGGNCCCRLSCWSILCCERTPACLREGRREGRQARAEEREALVQQEQGTAKASTQ